MQINKQITQKIINTIPNPIIIKTGAKMQMANQNSLEFFEENSIEEFLRDHNCVCELFQEKQGYFSLSLINDNTIWTDYLYSLQEPQKVSILCKNNNSYSFNIAVNKINNDYLVVFTNITAAEQNVALTDIAYHDHLTHIYNRQMFDKLYKKELENKKRHGDSLSLVMFDIDHFKNLNDNYGHDIGDNVLVTLAKLIIKHLRTTDIFARWGGEEFLILMPRTNIDIAYDKANELRQILAEHSNQIPKFTASFGVTEIKDYDKEQSAFIRVDKALYQAKVKRNDVVQL